MKVLLDLALAGGRWVWNRWGKREVERLIEGEGEPGTPLPYAAVEHQRRQIDAATSHKVGGYPPKPK